MSNLQIEFIHEVCVTFTKLCGTAATCYGLYLGGKRMQRHYYKHTEKRFKERRKSDRRKGK